MYAPPRTPNVSLERGTGGPNVVGANPWVEPEEALDLSALARQLTPEADERWGSRAGSRPRDVQRHAVRLRGPRGPGDVRIDDDDRRCRLRSAGQAEAQEAQA